MSDEAAHNLQLFYYVRCRRAVLSAEAAHNLQLIIVLYADTDILSAETANNLQLKHDHFNEILSKLEFERKR